MVVVILLARRLIYETACSSNAIGQPIMTICLKLVSLKVGLDKVLIAIGEVLNAKRSHGECTQEIHL
jgi:hypothetical protein